MNPNDACQIEMLIKRQKYMTWLFLGFISLFAWFGIRLSNTESAMEWKEADITIASVQFVSHRPRTWKITDVDGNTYTAHESQSVMNQVFPQSTYHIFLFSG